MIIDLQYNRVQNSNSHKLNLFCIKQEQKYFGPKSVLPPFINITSQTESFQSFRIRMLSHIHCNTNEKEKLKISSLISLTEEIHLQER